MTVSLASIQHAVCAEFHITLIGLLSDRRAREFSWPRQAACYLAKELTGYSLTGIARQFGLDHTTVLYGHRTCARRMVDKPAFAERVERVRAAVMEADGRPILPAMLTAAAHRVTFRLVKHGVSCLTV